MGWDERAISDFIVAMQQGDEAALNMARSVFDPMRQALLGPAEQFGGELASRYPHLIGQAEGLYKSFPELFASAQGQYYTPEMQALTQALTGMAGGMQGTRDLAAQGFASGGWTPRRSTATWPTASSPATAACCAASASCRRGTR